MKKMIILILTLSMNSAYPHGENKPGPHGGHIRMPGAFHTELVQEENSVSVYLLDVGFKNPLVENSSVTLASEEGQKTYEVKCRPSKDHFRCELPVKLSQLKEIKLKAVRKGAVGKETTYPLPLSFGKASAGTDNSHSHHH